MRLHLSFIALTWAPALAQYACTICRGGVGLTKPDGMVTTNQGQTASCEALTQNIARLSEEACESLQHLATEPCGCPGYEASIYDPSTFTSAPEPDSVASESDSFACSVCESGEMRNPTAYTINSVGIPISCQELQDTSESISESECARVRSFATTPCGCDGDAPTTIDILNEGGSDTFTCSICGNGAIGNPNGIVVNDRGMGKTCAELETNKASIPTSMCLTLQNTAQEPCECVYGLSVQADTTGGIETPLVFEIEEVISECSICGNGEITIPNGVVTTRNGRSATCDVLESNPTEITPGACGSIQAMAKQPCGCVFPYQEPDTSILDDIVPFECLICQEGEITIPDGVVTTPEGQAARCSALQANAKSVPEDICPDIQQLSNGPCGCTKLETATAEEAAPIAGQDIDESEVCHVCRGAAQKIGNPANMVTTPIGMFTCYSILSAGLDGAISIEDCGAVQTSVEQECGCYVDEQTPAPSEGPFQCPVCGNGMFVTQPEGIVNPENSMTCAQYQEEAARGRIDEDQCSVLQQMSEEACGCQPPPSFPTDAPTSYECQVCGVGREVGLPDAEVMLPSYQKMSCATLQERAETGVIHYTQCARFVPLAQQYCGCRDKQYEASPPSNYDCNICGPGMKVTNAAGVVVIPSQSDRTCIELMTEAAYGNINQNQCSLLAPFVQGPCGCVDPYADMSGSSTIEPSVIESSATSPTESLAIPSPAPSDKRGDCFQDLGKIQALERGVKDTSVTRMYILCPDKTFDMGVWTEEGEIKDGQPFLALRPNVIYQCGHDGSRTNNCILKGGDFGVASYYEVYNGIHEAVPGVEIKGLTFESQNLFSVILKSAGDITFTGCAFKGNSNNVPVLMQWEEKEDTFSVYNHLEESEGLKQVVTFEDCVFRDNAVDDSLSFPGIIENTFNSELIVRNCLFQDNIYGSNNNPASTGYAIRSFGPLTLESTCFVDNVFFNNGPVLVYGAQYSASDNYVESSQKDLTCELGALFSSRDDMAETTPSCESSDARVCAFNQGSTASPTIVPTLPLVPEKSFGSSSTTTAQVNQATSSAVSVTGRQLFTVGATTALPVLLALCLSVFDL